MRQEFKNIVRRRAQSGVAMIELAISIPVLIILLIVLFECGRLYSVYLRFTDTAWEGARFFSSLSDPAQSCISSLTTNLAYADSAYVLDAPNPKIFESHKIVQDRVLSLFLYDSGSWPIQGFGEIPCSEPPCGTLESSEFFARFPKITTQHIGSPPTVSCPNIGIPDLQSGETEDTVTVCLEATYLGLFFDLPLRTCSTSHLLENNETLGIPYGYTDY